MIGYHVTFASGEESYLFHRDYWGDKAVFYKSHLSHLEKVFDSLAETGLPLMINDVSGGANLIFMDAVSLDEWFSEYQGTRTYFVEDAESDEALYAAVSDYLLELSAYLNDLHAQLTRAQPLTRQHLVNLYVCKRKHHMLVRMLKRIAKSGHGLTPAFIQTAHASSQLPGLQELIGQAAELKSIDCKTGHGARFKQALEALQKAVLEHQHQLNINFTGGVSNLMST